MKSKLSIFLLCGLTLSLVSCATTPRRSVVTASSLRKGAVMAVASPGKAPVQKLTVWNSGDPAHGCDVTVSYHGEDFCEAHLEYVSPADPRLTGGPEPTVVSSPTTNRVTLPMAGPLNPFSTRRAGSAGATITLQNVTEVALVCGDSVHAKPGECAFSIKDIDCSRKSAQVYQSRKHETSLARAQVVSPSGRRVVWAAPQVGGKTSPCSVTALLRGSRFCNARVWTSDALGNVTGFEFAREDAGFVTFHNIAKLELECGSTADKTTGDCLVEIVQTECDK